MNNCKNCGCYFDELPKPEVEKALCHTCDLAALRAENERLKARGIERMQYRIAELEAALKEVQDSAAFHADVLKNRGELSAAHHWRVEANRAAAALKGEGEGE